MKSYFIVVFAALNVVLAPAFSQVAVQPAVISVSGTAEVKVAPDEIYLRVGVETHRENLESAKKENDERVAKVLEFLKTGGIKAKDIQTDFISIDQAYDKSVSWTRPATYVVRKSIEVKLTRIESFEGILSGMLTNGVNTVHGIDFRTSQLRKHRDAARAMAIRAAREKADAMAAELGVKRGKVHNVSARDGGGWWSGAGSYWASGNSGMYQNAVQNAGGAAETGEGTLSVGQISVSASVDVSFLIE